MFLGNPAFEPLKRDRTFGFDDAQDYPAQNRRVFGIEEPVGIPGNVLGDGVSSVWGRRSTRSGCEPSRCDRIRGDCRLAVTADLFRVVHRDGDGMDSGIRNDGRLIRV